MKPSFMWAMNAGRTFFYFRKVVFQKRYKLCCSYRNSVRLKILPEPPLKACAFTVRVTLCTENQRKHWYCHTCCLDEWGGGGIDVRAFPCFEAKKFMTIIIRCFSANDTAHPKWYLDLNCSAQLSVHTKTCLTKGLEWRLLTRAIINSK